MQIVLLLYMKSDIGFCIRKQSVAEITYLLPESCVGCLASHSFI